MLSGRVESVIFKGVHYESRVRVGDRAMLVHSTVCEPVGSEVGLTVIPFDIHIMKKSTSPASQAFHYDEEGQEDET